MKLHEYQSKKLLLEAGLPVPASVHVSHYSEVKAALSQLGIKKGVVKAQAYTGGRGKAGGIKLFKSETEAIEFTKQLIGMQLVTHQTGPDGVKVHSVLIEEASNIDKEFYVAILLDRAKVSPLIMISPDGGMDIEAVAEQTPDRILRLYPEFGKALSDKLKSEAARFLGLSGLLANELGNVLQKLFDVYLKYDASLLEINPLITTAEGHLAVLDCKFDIDDNAAYRQLGTGGDPNADKTPAEIEAAKFGMSYISLDGNIGCMVNGAGLAMATMDSIKHNGGEPANFLDVGGSASQEAVTHAFNIISNDHAVGAILVNIFGGIMKCDTIANGIVAAVKKSGLKVPLVVRLEGTNVELGKEIIRNSGLNIISADNLDDAAHKAVSVTKK
ncbi:MAG TPA: ADP-forming succinate--CoA ligase subunit beta [Prolixibacteraceae bacterium]|nr:ADP-forming succinate--CoA ligase subunit beta [Prolixibacteraceae bacterium]HPR59802.1 ADP-forming succinate--CoA ligase subunit beta [Prolixibacteraceae bacterium]